MISTLSHSAWKKAHFAKPKSDRHGIRHCLKGFDLAEVYVAINIGSLGTPALTPSKYSTWPA